jgi:hypothetical protein
LTEILFAKTNAWSIAKDHALIPHSAFILSSQS